RHLPRGSRPQARAARRVAPRARGPQGLGHVPRLPRLPRQSQAIGADAPRGGVSRGGDPRLSRRRAGALPHRAHISPQESSEQDRRPMMLAPNPPRRTFAGKAALWGGALAVVAIYLFATRPAPLADGQAAGRTVPIERVFRILAAENDAARALWTADMV